MGGSNEAGGAKYKAKSFNRWAVEEAQAAKKDLKGAPTKMAEGGTSISTTLAECSPPPLSSSSSRRTGSYPSADLPALSLPVVLLSTGAKGNAAGVLLATIGEADGKVSSPEMGRPSFDPRSPSPSSAVLREASPPWEVVVVGVVTSTLSEAMLRGG